MPKAGLGHWANRANANRQSRKSKQTIYQSIQQPTKNQHEQQGYCSDPT